MTATINHIAQVIAPAVYKLTSGEVTLRQADRLTAETLCDKFKKSPEGAVAATTFFQFILTHEHAAIPSTISDFALKNEALHHFLLQVIFRGIRHQWDTSYSEERKNQIKSQFPPLLLTYCSQHKPSTYLSQKAAEILADIAKREWPQKWPEFHVLLLQGAKQGSFHMMHVIVATLANISEDCTNPHYHLQLPAKRRSQVREGLRTVGQSLVAFLMNAATTSVAKFQAGGSDAKKLLLLVLRALQSFALWLPLDSFVKGNPMMWSFISSMARLSTHPHLQRSALQVVLSGCERTDIGASKVNMQEQQEFFVQCVLCCTQYHASVSSLNKLAITGGSLDDTNLAEGVLLNILVSVCNRLVETLIFNQSIFVKNNASCVGHFLKLVMLLGCGAHPSCLFPMHLLNPLVSHVLPLIDLPKAAAVAHGNVAMIAATATPQNDSIANRILYDTLRQLASNAFTSALDLYYFVDRLKRYCIGYFAYRNHCLKITDVIFVWFHSSLWCACLTKGSLFHIAQNRKEEVRVVELILILNSKKPTFLPQVAVRLGKEI